MISIVIPAYNEEKVIGKCLDAFVKQKTKQKFEVILVNNNSTDETVSVVKTYQDTLSLTVCLQKIKGRGAARQMGFHKAKGEMILSTDADTIVPPDWIDKLTTSLQKSNAVAISGTCKINDCGSLTNYFFNIFQPLSMRIYRLIFGHYWLSGFNFAIYRNAYEASGGFNPTLNVQEDVDLAFKVSKIGKINFVGNIPVIFSGRRFQNGLLKGLLPYVKTFITYFFYKKNDVILSDIR